MAAQSATAGSAAPVRPERATWQELASSRHIFDLVSIEGQVQMEAREDSQDEYVLISEGHMFSAVYPHGPASGALVAHGGWFRSERKFG